MPQTRISLADQAYQIIKKNIINLTYPPGMPLTEVMLTEELNMSRNPIRTAVKMLQTEGLIVTDYHKSMKVKDITEKDINEIYEFREILETEAFRRIFELGKAEEYSYRIEEKVVRMCAAAGDNYEWEIADTNMHLEIISIFDNERITHAYQSNLAECIRMGVYSVRHGMEIRKTNQNLKKMVTYMRRNDYENAFEILKADHFGTGRTSALSPYEKP